MKVPGEGPVPCDLMIIGEGPGRDEDKCGRPFVGKSGKELNRYLWTKCRRTRTSVYVTNLVKYRTSDNDDDPTVEDIERDEPELVQEVRQVNPEVIATVGRWSTRWVLGDVDMDSCHGVVHNRQDRIVVPCIHPAAGLHNTEFQARIAWDFEQLGKVLSKDAHAILDSLLIVAQPDEYPEPDYQDIPKKFGAVITRPAAVDTEGSVRKPWGLSVSTSPGTAINCRWGGISFKDRVIMHSALHDLPVLDAMGVKIADDQFDDTMIKAYLLCVEPQGLKSLCRRHCGMEMQDYQQVMGDASMRHANAWLDKVIGWLNKQSSSVSAVSKAAGSKPHSGRPTNPLTSGRGGRKSKRTSLGTARK